MQRGFMVSVIFDWVKRHPIWTGLITLVLAGIGYLVLSPAPITYEYIDEDVGRGEVVSKVSASGKLRALNTIKVGAEVSGQVTRVLVDFNSTVKAGQVLAEIDSTRSRARVQQAQAQVSLAQASLAQAEAAVARSRSDSGLQQREFARREELARQGYVSKSGLDTATGQVNNAQASLRTSLAQVASARAQIQQSLAELSSARLELSRTIIVSPTSGVVINKLVEPGTTVASGFQTPNLFEIAADTSRMQVEASVDEADIGQIKEGQEVRFTVDAYPDQKFPAAVTQIRKAASENQNVVSYLVILQVENKDGLLLPGMTANVEVITGAVRDVVRVPVQALRFKPKEQDRSEAEQEKDKNPPKDDPNKKPEKTVYVVGTDPLKPVRRVVQLGLEGEDFVEVKSGLKPNEKIVLRSRSLEKKEDASEDEEGNGNDAAD
jgi:HlyD family secretion protein